MSLPYACTFNPSACQEDGEEKLDLPRGQQTGGQEKENETQSEREGEGERTSTDKIYKLANGAVVSLV